MQMELPTTTAASLILMMCAGAIAVSSAPPGAGDSCSAGTVSRLYLGQRTPDATVTEAQWRVFVTEAVSTRFPDGFTELAAHGHWRDPLGRPLEEPTRIVEIAHDDSPQVRHRVRAIAIDYQRRFEQQSVLVTQSRSLLCFQRGNEQQ